MEVNNNKIEYNNEIQGYACNSNRQVIITLNNTIQYFNNKKLLWECKIIDLLPIDYIDTCAISKSILVHVHSTLLLISEKKEIEEIIQLEQEIHSFYALNDFNTIGVFQVFQDVFEIYCPKLTSTYSFFSNQCVQFDISISFQPYRLSCFKNKQSIHFILVRNLEYSRIYYQELIFHDNIISISECKNRLVIIGEEKIFTILISPLENTLTEEEYIKKLCNWSLASFPSTILNGESYHSNNDYIFKFDSSGKVNYFNLIEGGNNRIQNTKTQEKILSYDFMNNLIIVLSQSTKIYMTVYNEQFHQVQRYELNKQFEFIKYCPYYKGIIICEQKVQYQDKEPNNNYILMTETLQQTFLQLIDFHTSTYQNEQQQHPVLSYLLHGKNNNSISCGFLLDYPIQAISNIWKNRFVITTAFKVKIVEIYNNPYEMVTIFEFGVLNQQLITFRSSLPLEDLERIDFLKQTEQRILFSYWGQAKEIDSFQYQLTGIIHSVYGVKWIKLTNENATVSPLQTAEMRIQKVLQEGSDYFYILCNDEEVYKITEKDVKLIYISGQKLTWYASRGNKESIILKESREMLVTEFENPQKIKYSLQI